VLRLRTSSESLSGEDEVGGSACAPSISTLYSELPMVLSIRRPRKFTLTEAAAVPSRLAAAAALAVSMSKVGSV
jgi:hypothetical protein